LGKSLRRQRGALANQPLTDIGPSAIHASTCSAGIPRSTAPVEELARVDSVHLYGPGDMEDRVPTFALMVEAHSPAAVVKHLAGHRIFAWAGTCMLWKRLPASV
jgi:selenocysteine lyase/cysteine desulfurase